MYRPTCGSSRYDPGLFRVNGVPSQTLVANTFQGVGIAGITSGGVFNQSRYRELISAHFRTRRRSQFIVPLELLPADRTILDLLNVKYVVTLYTTPEQRAELDAAGLVPAMSDGGFTVFRNPTVWPRAFVVHDYRVAVDRGSAIRSAGSGTRDVAILEDRPGFPEGGGPATSCHIVFYGSNQVRVAGNDNAAGMLVLLDSFGEGWVATVNGKPSPIVPAYGAFRGVEVPAGRWEVTMTFQSPALRSGVIISTIGVGMAVIALCSRRRLFGSWSGDSGRPSS